MSNSKYSMVTYTEVSSPFEDLSDIGSSGVDELPMMPEDPYSYVVATFQAPPSLKYVPGPEEPEQTPHPPEFVPEHVYPEFMPPEYEVFPAEEQPLPADISPTADSPRYVADSDLEEDEEDPEEDPDDDDDVQEDEDEDEEEEDHLSLADSVLPPVHRVTARMYIRDQPPIPFWSKAEIDRLLAIPSPLPSPLSPLSSPLPQIPSPLLPVSPPLPISPPPLPTSPTYPLGYRDDMIRLRSESPSTSHLLQLPSPVILPHARASVAMIRVAASSTYILASRSETPPSRTPPLYLYHYLLHHHLCFFTLLSVEQGTPAATDMAGLSQRMTNFVMTVRQDTDEIYGRLDDAQDDRLLMSGQLNMLHRDRRAHARTARLMETEARLSCETVIGELQAADYMRQTQLTETLTLMRTLQTQVTALQSQQGPTSSPIKPKIPEEAGSNL
ncbi:hypothetical protein Tco_1460054 [Tanacetum coccineum]